MGKNYDGRIFLTQKEIVILINALSNSAKEKLSGLSKSPFLLEQVLESVKPEEDLRAKLNSYLLRQRG